MPKKGFLDALKKITGIDLPKLKNIVQIKLVNSSNNSFSLIHIDNSKNLIIPLDKLNGDRGRELKQLLRNDALDAAGAIIAENSMPTVQTVLDTLPSIDNEVAKFSAIIPSADIPLLKSCLYLRSRYLSGAPVEDLKRQIVSVYGQRGGNFANLVSAGYLETWFSPLYDGLTASSQGDAEEAKVKFRGLYKTIVNELPWTEFICVYTSAAKTIDHIVAKLNRNAENGVRYMNIHGIGAKNVKKLEKILPEIETQTGAVRVRIDQDTTRIFVRLELPVKQLDSGKSGF